MASKFIHTARFQTFDYLGVADPPALSWNLDFAKVFAQTRLNDARPAVGAAPLYRSITNARILDPEFERTYTIAKKKLATGAPGVTLDYSLVYPASINNATGALPAIVPAEDSKYLERLSNAFGGPGMGYIRNEATDGQVWRWVEIGGPALGQDESFARRFYLHKPTKASKMPTWVTQWGNFAFRVVNGRASLAKLSAKWSFDREKELWYQNELAADDETPNGIRDTAKDTAEDIERDIFIFQQSLNSDGELYGRPHELIVIPAGQNLAVFLDGKLTLVPAFGDSELQSEADYQKYVYAPLWTQTAIKTGASQACFWANGYPEFRAEGEIRLGSMLGVWESSADLPINQIDTRVNGWTPAGTTINVTKGKQKNAAGESTPRVEIVAQFTTTNRRVSPVAFRLGVVLKGGPLNGGNQVTFDTETLKLENIDKDAIIDVVPQFDGEGKRRQYLVLIRLKKGANIHYSTFPDLVKNYELLENRKCTLYIDGQAVLTGGIVANVELADASSFAGIDGKPAVGASLARGESVLGLTICDGWYLLEEKRTRDEIGDGRYRGNYLRLLLGNAGFSTAQLAGIANNAGGVLRPAFPGDDWRIRPARGQKYADWVRQFVKEYCPGWVLFQDAGGVWRFQLRSRVSLASFSSRADTNISTSYPGRYTIFRKLKLQRDTKAADFANVHSIVAGENGEINRNWRIEESIKDIGGARSRAYVGRAIEGDLIEDSSIQTTAEADAKLRRTVEDQDLPRFGDVETYFHSAGGGARTFFPGDYASFDGIKCKIVRGASGSIRADRMSFGVQEAAR